MSDAIDTKDTKEAGDMLPAMTADEKMIQDGFNELLKDYLNSNHRRKVERITKAFNFANQAHARRETAVRRTLYHAPHCRCTDCLP